MYVTDDIMTHKLADTFYTFPNNCRTQMSYMERFCNVWSAVVDHDCLWLFYFVTAKSFIFLHAV